MEGESPTLKSNFWSRGTGSTYQDKINTSLFYYLNINQISKITIKNVNQVSSMNSKKQTQILPEIDLRSHRISKMELSVKNVTGIIITK